MDNILNKIGGGIADLERFNSVSAMQVNRNVINQEQIIPENKEN